MVNLLEEKSLIEKLKNGETSAFELMFVQYRDKVYNTALGLLQNKEDAKDISQEVFVEVFRSIHNFRMQSALTTWIYRITVQKSLEWIRVKNQKKRYALIVSLFGKEDQIQKTDNTPFYHPGVLLENKERAAILFQAISRLTINQRTAFTLHKVELLSYAEIADVMQRSLPSVESLIHRAKQNLKKQLSMYYEKNEQ